MRRYAMWHVSPVCGINVGHYYCHATIWQQGQPVVYILTRRFPHPLQGSAKAFYSSRPGCLRMES